MLFSSSSRAHHRARFFFAGFTLFLFASLSFAQDSFMQGVLSDYGNDGSQINRGDFNNDGIPDIVIANNGGDGITVYLGNGDGTFKPMIDSAPGFGAFDMAVGDFNGDGNLDLALGGYFYNNPYQQVIQIMLGNGDGTFTAGQVIDVTGDSITTADFNNDGKLDLAISADKQVSLYEGAGNGTFTSAGSVMVGSPNPITQVRVGDFNGDGKPDLAVSDLSDVYVLWGNGNFTFNLATIATFNIVGSITATDVNQDGDTDLIVAYYNCTNGGKGAYGCPDGQIYLGVAGKENLKKGYTFPAASTSAGFSYPIAADINGDGFNDIIASGGVQGSAVIQVWLGNSNGTYQTTPLNYFYQGGGPIVASDYNRDGKIDLAVTTPSFLAYVLLNATPQASLCKAGTSSPSITECSPVNFTYLNSPVHVNAVTTDTAHKVTDMQLYANYSLIENKAANSLNYEASLADGSYLLVTKAWDSSGADFVTDRSVNVYTGTPGETCPTPANSLTICSPTKNATTSTSVHVLANADSSSNVITAVQVYIDNKLVYDDTSQSTYVDTTFTVAAGSHDIVVKAFDADGNIFSQSVTVNAQ